MKPSDCNAYKLMKFIRRCNVYEFSWQVFRTDTQIFTSKRFHSFLLMILKGNMNTSQLACIMLLHTGMYSFTFILELLLKLHMWLYSCQGTDWTFSCASTDCSFAVHFALEPKAVHAYCESWLQKHDKVRLSSMAAVK